MKQEAEVQYSAYDNLLKNLFYEVKRYILAEHLGRADSFGLMGMADNIPAPKSPDREKRVVRKP